MLLCVSAVVSVDQAAVVGLAAHTTGQPLQLAAQGAAMQQPSYVYQLPGPNPVLQQGGQGYPVTPTIYLSPFIDLVSWTQYTPCLVQLCVQ